MKTRLSPGAGAFRAALFVTVLAAASSAYAQESLAPGLYARIETTKGTILIRLEPERAPITTMNFVGLAEGAIATQPSSDRLFYDGLTFHRVEPGFVIQGGDPAGNGTGGPGYRFPTETHPELLHDGAGVVAMANSGPDSNGSQFYITMGATPHLDGGYNVFGRVVEGLEVVSQIRVGDRMTSVRIVRSGTSYRDYTANTATFRAAVAKIAALREEAAAAVRDAEIEVLRRKFPAASPLADTGIFLLRTKAGSGSLPVAGETISAHLTMSLLDGTLLSDTRAAGRPFEFGYLRDRLLPGLETVFGAMLSGERVVAVIPPRLAFGEQGSPPVVPAGKYVVFDIERLAK